MFTPFRLFILCPMLGVIMIFNTFMNSRPITNRTRASQCYQSPKKMGKLEEILAEDDKVPRAG